MYWIFNVKIKKFVNVSKVAEIPIFTTKNSNLIVNLATMCSLIIHFTTLSQGNWKA